MAVNYRKTLISCYLGFITQAIAANFAPLLFLTFHNGYGIPENGLGSSSGRKASPISPSAENTCEPITHFR